MCIFDAYIFTYTVSAENLILPDETTATNEEWEKWAESYLRNPSGKILQIRIGLTQ